MSADSPSAALPSVVLVVALQAEARPLIDHFEMASGPAVGRLSVFNARHIPVSLVVSGVGRVSAGAAVAAMALQAEGAAWLNVGIAGQARRRLGETLLAHRIRDAASGRCWYPPVVFAPACPTASVQTVDRPCTDYPDEDLYEMEAAGFYEIAARHASHELIQCLKVVSDNRDSPAAGLDARRVSGLIEGSLPVVARTVETLGALSQEMRDLCADPPRLQDVERMAHFSVTRRRQLRRLLRRWSHLYGESDVTAWLRERNVGRAGGMLEALESHLDDQAPILRDDP